MRALAFAGLCLLMLAACSSDDDSSSAGASGAAGNDAGAGGSSGSAGASGAAGSGFGGGQAGAAGQQLSAPFAYGFNSGHTNAAWGDDEYSGLASELGLSGERIKLPEYHLAKWGWDIEVGDMKARESQGVVRNVAFLIGPSADHSTAPAGTESWKLDYYRPANLYEPIFLQSGEINPANYWAAYVYQTVSLYKPWVKVWQVWNEPDWVEDWKTTGSWETQPPTAQQLVRFGGSIFEYVRMLRVTTEAARKADPQARIALGGIGYPSFLSALLRYTDEPQAGAVTADYAKKGGEWFDVLDFHFYPVFAPGNSDDGADGLVDLKKRLEQVLAAANVSGKTWMVTETGAPSVAVGTSPGGAEYARNYYVKAMTMAQAEGISGVHWFLLTDGGGSASSQDPFQHMGLYGDIVGLAEPSQAVRTQTGSACDTIATLLRDASFSPSETAGLALPATVRGAAFRMADSRMAAVLWARAQAGTEEASVELDLPIDRAMIEHAWDWSTSAATTKLTPENGKLHLSLTASPVVLIEQ